MKLNQAATALFAGLFSLPSSVDGHAYMTEPFSRNHFANIAGTWGSESGRPPVETTPHGLNSNTGVCGKEGGAKDYDLWLDSQGNPMPWITQTTYAKGDEIEVDVKITAHHFGHFSLAACPMGRASTQECFDANPLEFVADLTYGMPKDPNHPDRAMLHGDASEVSYKFKLPENVVGEQVLLQWIYWTANSCSYNGYQEYFSNSNVPAANRGNWSPQVGPCGPISDIPLIREGTVIAEIFVNCAEVEIAGNASPSPPILPSPTNAPVVSPTVVAPTNAPVAAPPTNPDIIGTCGGGQRGNGYCPDQSMCCSQWGYCGTSGDHCDGTPPPPVENPVQNPVVDPNEPIGDLHGDSRLIAYLGNWHECPSDEQMAQYTHVVIAFAVSYTWSPGKNICSETCDIATPPVCGNSARPDLIQKWKSQGKKIILSFGGAGMGGSWAGDNNDCWDYCFGREEQVVNRLTEIVNDMNLDGVDIDYEYFYEDNQNGSGFTKGAQAQKFLKDVTVGLRNSMPAGAELTHAPMEPDMEPDRAYFQVLKEIAHTLDFLMPQYYNGYVRSHSNFPGALAHFTDLTNQMFNGDASKIVYGFCINDCGTFNLDGYKSAEVMEQLSDAYPCNGGAFNWVINDDVNGAWSKPVKAQLALDSQNCADRNPPVDPQPPVVTTPSPTNAPVVAPTNAPVAPVPNPTNLPTSAPIVNPTMPPIPAPSEAPVQAQPEGNGSSCCSYDFKTCATWGNESQEACESLTGMKWLPTGPLTGDAAMCIGKDAGCTDNQSGCCEGLVCDGNQWWKSCKAAA